MGAKDFGELLASHSNAGTTSISGKNANALELVYELKHTFMIT